MDYSENFRDRLARHIARGRRSRAGADLFALRRYYVDNFRDYFRAIPGVRRVGFETIVDFRP